MGCGQSSNPSAVHHPSPVPSRKVQGNSDWEDEKIMYDADLEREAKCTRVDAWGRTVRPFTRDANVPNDNSTMVAFLQQTSPSPIPVFPPETPQERYTSLPEGYLELEYIYGYSAIDSRHNLGYAAHGEQVVYPSGCIGVVLDVAKNSQRYFGGGLLEHAHGHSDFIQALALSPDRVYVATGEVGVNPKICVWKCDAPENGPVLEFRQGTGSEAVDCICFAGNMLVACDYKHVLRVFDGHGAKVQEEKLSGRVLEVAYGAGQLAAAGERLLCFWTESEKAFKPIRPAYGSVGKLCSFTSVKWLEQQCLAGGTNGQLYVWSAAQLLKTVQVLPLGASIHALCVSSPYVYVGGTDNFVHELDSTFTETRVFAVSSCPRALDCYEDKILCGGRDGSIMEMCGQEDHILIESHSDGEIAAIAADWKNSRVIVSTGEDNKVKLWDCELKKCVATGLLDPQVNSHTTVSSFSQLAASQQSRCVCFSPAQVLAVAHNDGHVSIRSGTKQLNNVQKTLPQATDWITAMSYSHDGSRLAVASNDLSLRIYDVRASYRVVWTVDTFTSPVISLDWGTSGQIIRSVRRDGTINLWKAASGQSTEEEEKWKTWTSPFGWCVEGIYTATSDPRYILSVDRHPSTGLVAVGTDWGVVQVFKFPCAAGARSRLHKAHANRVTAVRWSGDGSRLFSAGGYDQSIAQWRWVAN